MTNDIVFVDTETIGLDPLAPIWEFAAHRRYADGTVDQHVIQIRHDDPARWLAEMLQTPYGEQFVRDYEDRYNHDDALLEDVAAGVINHFTQDALVICCNPLFDLDSQRLTKLLQRNGIEPSWHYHPVDIASVAIGYLAGRGELFGQPWKSDRLAGAIGVNSADYPRHTALGDVRWAAAQWDVITGGVGGNGTRDR